ncbi:MAG: High-affinity nickel-transporter [Actinomycetota bacterium]
MRALRRILSALAITGIVVVVPAAAASAHPLGNFTVNRYAGLQLSPGRVDIDYVVDLAEIPTQQERPAIDANENGDLEGTELDAWARARATDLARGLRVDVNGAAVALRVTCATARATPGQGELLVLRLEAGFMGAIADRGTLTLRDTNDEERIGWREITAIASGGTAISSSSVPGDSESDRLRAYPEDLLSSPPDVRQARVAYAPGASDAMPLHRCGVAADAAAPATKQDGGFAGLLGRGSTPLVLGLGLLLAAGFGALHAMGPGHGKTLMAGYLVGSGARVRQAVAVGGAVAVMHTASVLGLGVLVMSLERTFRPEQVYPWLGVASGLVAVGLGALLLVRRLGVWSERGPSAGTAEHAPGAAHHAPHDHAPNARHTPHAHDHGLGVHDHVVPDAPVLSRKGLVALAVAGGILPSPTALVVLLSAVSLHRVGFGLALIGAFSVGLAAALVVVGLVTIRAGDAVAGRMSSRLGRAIPVVSSAAVVLVGLVLTFRGIAEL